MKMRLSALSILFVGLQLMTGGKAEAQGGSVGIGTSFPDQSAVLDVSSTSKGVLFPRMSRGQRDAIQSPAAGLLIYQTDENAGFYYYMNGWQPISSSLVSGANRTLSNLLAPISVNVDLLPIGSGDYNIGSPSNGWRDIYLTSTLYLQGSRYLSMEGTNNFFGTNAGNPSISGSDNTAIGKTALANNTSGHWNTAAGAEAMYLNSGGYTNASFGYRSMFANTGGSFNSSFGGLALSSLSIGQGNTVVGTNAMHGQTSGNDNVVVGHYGGQNFSGNNNSFLGAYSGTPVGLSVTNSTAVGFGTSVTGSNMMRFGNSTVSSIGGQVNWTALSDGRFKQNVSENVPGLKFINSLRPVTYNLDVDKLEKITNTVKENERERFAKPALPTPEEISAKAEKSKIKFTGFIAQEVQEAAAKIGYQFSGVDVPRSSQDLYGLRYAEFVVPLVKAVQELSIETEKVKTENISLRQKLEEQTSQSQKQQAKLDSQDQQIQELKKLILDLQKRIPSEKTPQGQ